MGANEADIPVAATRCSHDCCLFLHDESRGVLAIEP